MRSRAYPAHREDHNTKVPRLGHNEAGHSVKLRGGWAHLLKDHVDPPGTDLHLRG